MSPGLFPFLFLFFTIIPECRLHNSPRAKPSEAELEADAARAYIPPEIELRTEERPASSRRRREVEGAAESAPAGVWPSIQEQLANLLAASGARGASGGGV